MRANHSQVGLGTTIFQLAGRRLLRRQEGERDGLLGAQLASQLDTMKGLGMKLGQIVSYMDVPIPQATRSQLERLQRGVQGMSQEETDAALKSALGDDYRRLFDALELEPFAAASIGQVHRATVSGQVVALKLQYPEAQASLDKDLGAIKKVASLASLASAIDGAAMVTELSERFFEECDYQREAQFQAAFGRAFAGHPKLSIPQVLEKFTTRSTLVSHWAEGGSLNDVLLQPETVRCGYAQALADFSYRSLFCLATIQADPHPGNFLFSSDGVVHCLDFGCTKTFDPVYVENLKDLVRSLDSADVAKFRDTTVALGMAPRPDKFDFDYHMHMMDHLHRPLLSRSHTFSAAYLKEAMAFNGPSSKNARTMGMPPSYLWVARLMWGLWALLGKLGATVSLRELTEELLSLPVRPLVREQN